MPEKSLSTEASHHWQAEAKSLARAGKVSYNQVLLIRDFPERFVLNREELLDATLLQPTNCGSTEFREVCEMTWIAGIENCHRCGVRVTDIWHRALGLTGSVMA